jgi:RNA recognition motif-containing protein
MFLPFPIASFQIKTTTMKIFVGNLSFGATEDTVRSLFENHGTVDRVSIMTDRDTGRSRGFGFVEMTNELEASKAMTALNGKEVAGRALTVNEARPKEDRGFGGFGQKSGGHRRTQSRW